MDSGIIARTGPVLTDEEQTACDLLQACDTTKNQNFKDYLRNLYQGATPSERKELGTQETRNLVTAMIEAIRHLRHHGFIIRIRGEEKTPGGYREPLPLSTLYMKIRACAVEAKHGGMGGYTHNDAVFRFLAAINCPIEEKRYKQWEAIVKAAETVAYSGMPQQGLQTISGLAGHMYDVPKEFLDRIAHIAAAITSDHSAQVIQLSVTIANDVEIRRGVKKESDNLRPHPEAKQLRTELHS